MKLKWGAWILALPIWVALSPTPASAADAVVPPSPKRAIELDEKALWAKKSAVQSLAEVARRNANTPREPALLLRLAEMHEDIAAIQYRLTFAKAGDKAADTSAYIASMNAALPPLNRLITQYANWKWIPRAYYLRSKALSETSKIDLAVMDLKKLVETWPTSKDAPVANMDLWRLLIQQKDYVTAIKYINRYGLRPDDRYYHAALEKLSWCHFYLGVVSEALRYTETELKTVKGLERDKALSNYALFYVTGIERKMPGLEVATTLQRFRSNATGNDLGSLVVSYAYLLRSKGMDSALDSLKEGVLSEEIADTYKSDVILITFENQFNRRQVADMKVSAEQEIKLFTKSPSLRKDPRRVAKIKTNFNEIIPGLQKLLVGAPAPQSQSISSTLRICYQFMLETSEGDVLEQSRIHFNMAEVSFELKEFEPAAEHYRWVVDHLKADKKEHQDLFLLASVKALDARYAFIKEKDWTPKSLAAKPLSTPTRKVPEPVTQWVEWIDKFPKSAFLAKKVDTHAFEANRIIYSFDQIQKATERLNRFSEQYPNSSFAVTSASLVMDTYIASQQWEDSYAFARKYLLVQEWKNTDFHARLVDLAADVYCKVLDGLYRDKKYELTIKNANSFVAENPNSKRRGDMLELAANAALAMGNRQEASEIFKRVLDSGVKKPEVTALAYMTQASLSEEKYNFAEAARHYRVAAGSSSVISDDLRAKILLWSWLSGDPKELDETLASEKVCQQNGSRKICSQYLRRYEETYGALPSRAISGSGAPIARLAMRERLTPKDRVELLSAILGEWSKLDPLDRAVVLPVLTARVPEAFGVLRGQVRKNSPLKLDRASIAKRTRMIEETQKVVEKLATLPALKIRLGLIRESAALYEDAAQDVLAIPPPVALKGDALKEFKQTLAEGASSFSQKAEELHKTEHELASQRGADVPADQTKKWASTLLDRSGANSAWSEVFKNSLEKGNWQLAEFLIERAANNVPENKDKVQPEGIPMLRAALLARSGATAEALEELKNLPANLNLEIESKLGLPVVEPTNKERVPASAAQPASKGGQNAHK